MHDLIHQNAVQTFTSYVHKKDGSIFFFFCNIFVLVFILGHCRLHRISWKYSFLINFLEKCMQIWYYFSFKYLIEFTHEAICACKFPWENGFNYRFNFFNLYSYLNNLFLKGWNWVMYVLEEIYYIQIFKFIEINVFMIFYYPFSIFRISLIPGIGNLCLLFFFLVTTLARGLSIVLIFSKNHL